MEFELLDVDVLRLTAKPNTKAAVEEAFKLVIAAEVDSH